MEIAAFFQCYKNKRAFTHAIQSFRRHYSDNPLYVINDGGDPTLEEISHEYRASTYIYSPQNIGKLVWHSGSRELAIDGVLRWLARINSCLQSLPDNSKYLLNLEDDVYVMNPVDTESLKYDINGCNYNATYISPRVNEYIRSVNPSMIGKKIFYGGCGGCIFRVEFFKRILSDEAKVRREVTQFCDLGALETGQMAADCVITFLTYINGGTIGSYPGFCEKHHYDFSHRLRLNNIQVLHRYTDLY